MKRISLLVAIGMIICPLAFTGCSQDQVDSLQKTRDQVSGVRNATTQAIDVQQTAIDNQRQTASTMPVDSDQRHQLESAADVSQKIVDKERSILSKADAQLANIDLLLAAAKAKDPQPAIDLASKIPVVGPYVGIFGALALWLIQKNKNGEITQRASEIRSAFIQVVQGVEKALPVKTPEQKAALSAAQDNSTKAMVAAAKSAM